MSLLSPEQVEHFKREGWVRVDQVLSPDTLIKARDAYNRMRVKCESGEYPFIRHRSLIDDNEIHGIEHIFHKDIFEPDILKALQEAKVIDRSEELLGEGEASLVLNRIHCNKKWALSSTWHRDGWVNETLHIQSALPFYDEAGFWVIPKSHRQEGNDDVLLKTYGATRAPVPGQVLLKVRAGDLLLFESSIFHRGTCPGRVKYQRAHIHLRYALDSHVNRIELSDNENWNHPKLLEVADEKWKHIVTKKRPEPKYYAKPVRRKEIGSFYNFLRQMKNRITYFLSALLPNDFIVMVYENRVIPFPYVRLNREQKEFFSKSKPI